VQAQGFFKGGFANLLKEVKRYGPLKIGTIFKEMLCQ
jgi:hypothetical protein